MSSALETSAREPPQRQRPACGSAPAGSHAGRLALGAAAFGLLILLLLPDTIVAINDDFGYLRSVIATLRHGRPWTDDWLEPWAASFSSISAGLFLLTKSFYAATYGLLAALSAAAFFALASLFSLRGLSVGRCVGAACLVLTSATVLWKLLEFTAMPLHVACLFSALYAAERRRWTLFAVVTLLALASRQSAVAWITLPACATAWALKDRAPATAVVRPIAVILTVGAGYYLCSHAMNVTHAQRVLTAHALERVTTAGLLSGCATGAAGFAIAAGIARLFYGRRGEVPFRWRRLRFAAFVIIAALVLLVDPRRYLSIEHQCYTSWAGAAYLRLLLVLAVGGWCLGRARLAWTYVVAAAGPVALLGLRSQIWDYYLVDVMAFGLAAVSPVVPAGASGSPTSPQPMRTLNLAMVASAAALAVAHAMFALQLKFDLDRAAGVCEVAERAVRKQALDPRELSFAPFGLIGWYWYPFYITHDGRDSPAIDGFGRYLRAGAIDVGQAYSSPLHLLPRFRHTPPSDRTRLAAWGRTRYAWVFHAEYYLLRAPADRVEAAETESQTYAPIAFPLNDREWRELIERP